MRAMTGTLGQIWILLLFVSAPLTAQGGLKVVENPGGGEYVYRPIAEGASERAIVVDMLTRIHQHFGAAPRVGQVLREKGGQSVSAFFDLKATPNGRPVSGMIILKSLESVTGGGATEATRPAGSKPPSDLYPTAPALPLTQTTFPDGSGSVGLPSKWSITESGGGLPWSRAPKASG